MPFLIPFIPAIATVGAAVIGANAAGKAQDKALAAQNASTQQSLAAQNAALDRITNLQQPFIDAGASVLPGIGNRVAAGAPNFSAPTYARPMPGGTPQPGGHQQIAGMQQAATAPPGFGPTAAGDAAYRAALAGNGQTNGQNIDSVGASLGAGTGKLGNGVSIDPASAGPQDHSKDYAFTDYGPGGRPAAAATAQDSGPDWDAYIAANPDVAAWIKEGHGDPNLGPSQTPEQAAAYQYHNTGQTEGRQLPMTAATPATPAAPQQPLDLGTASPVVANYTRPDQPSTPTFGASPDQANFFDPSKFATSPGYQFRLDQGLRDTNAKFGAKGLLQSGAALQGFNDYAQNSASSEYQNWFNQQQTKYSDAANQFNADRASGLNQFNLDRNNLNNNFADDRSYGTNLALSNRDFANNQYNTQTQNMFQLAGIGANAAGAVGSAVTGNANNSTNLFQNQGNNAANAAYANGQTQAQLAGTIGSTAANLFSGTPRASTLIPGSGSAPNGGYADITRSIPSFSYGPI